MNIILGNACLFILKHLTVPIVYMNNYLFLLCVVARCSYLCGADVGQSVDVIPYQLNTGCLSPIYI